MTQATADLLATRLRQSARTIESIEPMLGAVAACADALVDRLRNGGTIYTAGNGGSAAQALHLAEELIGRYRGNRPALRAVCLNSDPTALTCIANDFGFEHVFSRQCEALLTPRDALVVLSTSGRSPNVKLALQAARRVGCLTAGLLGRDGGECAPLCAHAMVAPEADSAFVQDAHQVIVHLLCEVVEHAFSG